MDAILSFCDADGKEDSSSQLIDLPSLDEVAKCAKRISSMVKRTRVVGLGTHLVGVGGTSHSSCRDRDAASDHSTAAAESPPAKRRVSDTTITSDERPSSTGSIDVYLKLENEQHCNTFKARAAASYITALEDSRNEEALNRGVLVASTGSFGQCMAWQAKQRNIKCGVIVPDFTDSYRQSLLTSAGVDSVLTLPFFDWWEAVETMAVPDRVVAEHPEIAGMHFVAQMAKECIAGDATVVNEILDEVPDVDAIIVPYGFGSFSCGSGIVAKARSPKTRIIAVEVSTSTPYRNALTAGKPSKCTHTPSFVSQLGGLQALPTIWDQVKESNGLISHSAVVQLDEVAEAIRLLKRNHDIIAEGAGAAPLAAALNGQAGTGKVVCVVTGGNMDSNMMSEIMLGATPESGIPIPPLFDAPLSDEPAATEIAAAALSDISAQDEEPSANGDVSEQDTGASV